METAFQIQAALQSECLEALRSGLETAIREEVDRRVGELSCRIDDCGKRLQVLAQTVAAIAPKLTLAEMGLGDYTPLHVDTLAFLERPAMIKAAPTELWVPHKAASVASELPSKPPGLAEEAAPPPRRPIGPPPNGPGPNATLEGVNPVILAAVERAATVDGLADVPPLRQAPTTLQSTWPEDPDAAATKAAPTQAATKAALTPPLGQPPIKAPPVNAPLPLHAPSSLPAKAPPAMPAPQVRADAPEGLPPHKAPAPIKAPPPCIERGRPKHASQ